MLFEIIGLSKFIIHGGQHKSIQQRLQCKNSSMYFIFSVYELFGIMFCQIFNHLTTSLNVRHVLCSFCVIIVFSSR